MPRTPVPEAKLVETEGGLKPEGDGWFIVNVADTMSLAVDDSNYGFVFEEAPGGFPELGINIRVLGPGKPASMYHAEQGQEAFLVLHGEGVLIVEDEERPLHRWDFVHCPPNTAHVVAGAGEGPCVVLMVGARHAGSGLIFPASSVAAKYGASVDQDTDDRATAYTGWSRPSPGRYPWPL